MFKPENIKIGKDARKDTEAEKRKDLVPGDITRGELEELRRGLYPDEGRKKDLKEKPIIAAELGLEKEKEEPKKEEPKKEEKEPSFKEWKGI